MDSKLILVAVIGVIAMAFGGCEAITCIQCASSDKNNYCSDPFSWKGVGTCTFGKKCFKFKEIKSGVSTTVNRTCGTNPGGKDECTEVTKNGDTTIRCVCSTDKCNDGQMVKPTVYNVIIGVAMATVMAIARMNNS
jgi:hypothetical protein